jgi:NAD(P)-dependent dehydrogenase (short-subunit alcohol dehydrogenase family)
VTGANGGLGLEVARELARKGAHVEMAARDQEKAKVACASIHDEIPEASLPARSIVVHPGFTNTDLQARSVRETRGGRSQRFYRAAVLRVGMTPAQGALSLLRAATDPSAVGGPSTPRGG